MCGIAGTFAYAENAAPVDQRELLVIRESMLSRGPDAAGIWVSDDGRAGLAHRRLAIIDLSEAGAQPMSSADGRFCITFNGEIYNYRELRKELESVGYQFRSNSDTEVLLYLYAERGAEMVHALRGMYAFAIFDQLHHSLFLVRDPFGIKPLYVSDDGRTLRFASQVKALLKSKHVDTSAEPAGTVGFFLWGSVPEPYTLYKGIRAFPAGTHLKIDLSGARTSSRFFDVGEALAAAKELARPITAREVQDRLSSAVRDSVRHHLIADVPVSVFLSAGLDSSTLAAVAMEVGDAPVRTVTLGFEEFKGSEADEVPLARLIAKHYGTTHYERRIAKCDFEHEYDHLLAVMDQPSIDGVNSYFVSKAAAETGAKVAISGLGADELFGGYPSFREIPKVVKALAPLRTVPFAGRAFRYVSAPFIKRFTSPKYAGIFELGSSYGGAYLLRRGLFMPWELPELLEREVVRDGWGELQTLLRLEQSTNQLSNPHFKVASLEMAWYMRNQLLRDADWAGMAHSLEIRLPFVDIKLFNQVIPLLLSSSPPDKRAMASIPVKRLPPQVLARKKTGFSIPVKEWAPKSRGRIGRERGLRGWAARVHANRAVNHLRVLALVTDAFGGQGGIALYNRDLLHAVCSFPAVAEVTAIPRNVPRPLEALPSKLTFHVGAARGKLRYLTSVLRHALMKPKADLIVCGHMNLLPIAFLLKVLTRSPVLLEIFGIDAWRPTRSAMSNYLSGKVDAVACISDHTKAKFLSWSGCPRERVRILPNAIHMERYGIGPKNPSLMERYDLVGKVVLMTLGRLSADERYKGIDQVLEVLPELARRHPNIAYLIVGDGTDRHRLEKKASELGLSARVVFAGLVNEEEKANHYRLADVFVMPSRGEGFGFVFLEAMACGVPVVASKIDGGREAVRNGELGELVDPDSAVDIIRGIENQLARPRQIPPGLQCFNFNNFESKTHELLAQMLLGITPIVGERSLGFDAAGNSWRQ